MDVGVNQAGHPIEPIEASLVELAEAERAGVFARTREPRLADWSSEPATIPLWFVRHRRFAVAALLAIAAGVWTIMFQAQMTSLRTRSSAGSMLLADVGATQASIARCLNGPMGSLRPDCVGADLDGDGDVDLNDIGAFQRSAVRSP